MRAGLAAFTKLRAGAECLSDDRHVAREMTPLMLSIMPHFRLMADAGIYRALAMPAKIISGVSE